jgi:hypothetical protein
MSQRDIAGDSMLAAIDQVLAVLREGAALPATQNDRDLLAGRFDALRLMVERRIRAAEQDRVIRAALDQAMRE